MTTPESVYADETKIYLATFQGTLFVLARDRTANFPLVESIQYTSALAAVRGDSQYLYVAAADGNLLVYRKDPQLALVQTLPVVTYGLSSLAVTQDSVFVGAGQTKFAVNNSRVYLAAWNEGDIVIELAKPTLTPVRTYGATFEEYKTVVFDRQTGSRVGEITPGNWNLYADETRVFGTVPGCCGSGIAVHDADSFALAQFIWRTWTNTVVQRGGFLIAGNETGNVDVFDLATNPSQLSATLNLRDITGHIWPEDIEIRALWADGLDNLIFAGSSWGNAQSRGPLLPSFFVLESTPGGTDRTPPTVTVLRPNAAGEKLFTATPFVIEWNAADDSEVAAIDVSVSTDGGSIYTPIAGCTGLAGTERRCTWLTPGPATSSGRIRVTATDAAGNLGADSSDANVSIVSGAGAINVSQPNTAVAWTIGTTQQIKWTHNLGLNSWVAVEVSRDNGATWETVAAAVQNATATSGLVAWSVTPPATTQGRVRVSALNGPVSDISNEPFAIAIPVITVTQPNTNVNWTIGSAQTIRWTHNVGVNTGVEIALSRDGGITWDPLALSVPNSGATSGTFNWVVTGPATTQGRIKVSWLTGPYAPVSDVGNVNFRIATPVITLGSTTIGSLLDSGDSHFINGSKVRTSAAGHIASMSVYVGNVDSLAANRQYQLAIYTDNAGRPGTLVAASASGTLVANSWNTLGVSASLLADANYWLMFNTNGRTSSVNNLRYNTGVAGQGAYSTLSVPFGTWPATFPAATLTNFVCSLFATFGP